MQTWHGNHSGIARQKDECPELSGFGRFLTRLGFNRDVNRIINPAQRAKRRAENIDAGTFAVQQAYGRRSPEYRRARELSQRAWKDVPSRRAELKTRYRTQRDIRDRAVPQQSRKRPGR